jgi:hypothetical protein
MLSGTASLCLTSISYLLLGKIGILKTEVEVARALAIRFSPLGINDKFYSENSSIISSNIFICSLNIGCFD